MAERTIDVHTDVKSPYAYLALAPARTLERDFRVRLNWLPYTLRIPDFLGSAEVDADGRVVAESRSPHQWRRVRYSYMDVRRYANLRGLTIRGPRKIWDSSLAHAGLLYAKDRGALDAYLDIVYERFWKRALDIEDAEVVSAALAEAGADPAAFPAWAEREGRAEHDRLQREAEEAGVFGVPPIRWTGRCSGTRTPAHDPHEARGSRFAAGGRAGLGAGGGLRLAGRRLSAGGRAP